MSEPAGATARLDGWLIIDKPPGCSSAQIVGRIKRLTGGLKVGHGGTLDPLATGVLPIAIGEATKTVAYVMLETKGYHFTLKWGEARDTDDSEGEIVETSHIRPSRQEIDELLPKFI
ncbi:uncharacterized protein METZ01_LOCUS311557, partial [marine metagenome]